MSQDINMSEVLTIQKLGKKKIMSVCKAVPLRYVPIKAVVSWDIPTTVLVTSSFTRCQS